MYIAVTPAALYIFKYSVYPQSNSLFYVRACLRFDYLRKSDDCFFDLIYGLGKLSENNKTIDPLIETLKEELSYLIRSYFILRGVIERPYDC